MSCDFIPLANSGVQGLHPYQPGKPIEELQRELGLSDIVKLASNENPLGPSPKAIEACRRHGGNVHRYPDSGGFELKHALSARLDVAPEQITLGCGSNDVLDLVARVFLDEGKSAVYSEHAFVVYPIAVQASGARSIVTPAKDWGHDLEAMADAVDGETRVMFVANPNNPTGTWSTRAEVEALLNRVPESVIVVLDEAYTEYVDDPDYPDGLSLLARYPNLIVTRTFSKAYGLAGLRVGYSISSPEIADLLNRVRAPFNVNSLALAAATAALEDDKYLAQSRELNSAGLHQLESGLKALGLSCIPSVGNFIAVQMPVDAAKAYDALLRRGVIVRPVGVYNMPQHLRVSVGLEAENQRFLDVLPKVLDEVRGD